MKYGLKDSAIQAICKVLEQYDAVEKAILYGSRAKGNFRPGSDIDLTLVGPDLTLSIQLNIETALDELLLPYTIDLSIHHHIENPELLEHIRRVGVVFYEKKRRGGRSRGVYKNPGRL
ncbi:MAG: nucleotidyltransferase domain-containing protein [Saprospirales bacterium]|nr:nucleotidyltransferase domain-containing protein [Saprospirales bacterium]MBK8921885.1 nucleotidyltransferase domain-containing protein [Saprospirales bacterium]